MTEQPDYIKDWLVGIAETTKPKYLRHFAIWEKFIKMTPTEQINKRVEDLTSKDLSQRTYFEKQWRAFKEHLEQEGKTWINAKTILTAVASFFGRNGLTLDLNKGDWKSTMPQKVIHRVRVTKDDVKTLYAHADLRDKALLLVLAQSGFSEIDVTELRIEDLKGLWEMPQNEHYFIEKPREKSNIIQATCISYEALHDIRLMLEERGKPQEGYLFVGQTKSKGEPITTRTIRDMMKALAKKPFHLKKLNNYSNLRNLEASIIVHY
jgi:hypothetical protein